MTMMMMTTTTMPVCQNNNVQMARTQRTVFGRKGKVIVTNVKSGCNICDVAPSWVVRLYPTGR